MTQARRIILAGGVVVALGVALVGTVSRDVGGGVLLVGWAVMVWGIHRFGRS